MKEKTIEDKLERLRKEGRVVNGFGIKVPPKRSAKRNFIIIYIILLIISILTAAIKKSNIEKEDIKQIIERIANYS